MKRLNYFTERKCMMWTEKILNDRLTEPSDALVEDMKKINDDILVLGAGGKMGHTICVLAKRAMEKAGIERRVIAVSTFRDAQVKALLEEHGVETIAADLQDTEQLNRLPDAKCVIYMVGRKFGTDGEEWKTWGVNSVLSAFVGEKYKKSRIVVFSSGNIYPIVPLSSGGCTEEDRVAPVGEYAQSCLARERTFNYYSNQFGTMVFTYRLNFAVDLRYGVLADIAEKIQKGLPISVNTPCFNCIWQGSAAEIAIRGLLHAASPAKVMNVTGPEMISVRVAANKLGALLGKEPVFEGEESNDGYLNNASLAMDLFGYPAVAADTLIRWQAEWILGGGRNLEKPTHFEERKGSY
jgi:uncharacterized protein YbjT (DUF2867 family)